MSAQESSFGRTVARGIGGFIIFALAVVILLGIGFGMVWPKVKATYYQADALPQPTQVANNTSELERMKAQNAAIQAELDAARATQKQQTIVQTVPEGAAPQPVAIPAAPPVPSGDTPPADPPQQIIVLHENDNHGAPIVTGSAACQVAAKGARRCGK